MAYATKPGDYPRLALYADGVWGKGSIAAFQTYAKRKGWYPQSYLIDGLAQKGTLIAMQKWLKYYGFYKGQLDGKLGVMWCTALTEFGAAKLGDYYFEVNPYYPSPVNVNTVQRWLNKVRW